MFNPIPLNKKKEGIGLESIMKLQQENYTRLICYQMQMNTWSYSGIPITAFLSKQPRGSSGKGKKGLSLLLSLPFPETTSPCLALRLFCKGRRNRVCAQLWTLSKINPCLSLYERLLMGCLPLPGSLTALLLG